LQRPMCSDGVVVMGVRFQNTTQMRGASTLVECLES
jgi:hypothetical protein